MKKAMQTLPKITLKQLAVFVSIYQTGSTSRASESLHLSQSAVSSALSELERVCRCRYLSGSDAG